MSQFFYSNPAARPPQGPKRAPWRRDLPRTWQAALDLPDAAPDEPREGAAGEAAPSVSPAPSNGVEETSK
jgi:hypothetical protein